MTAPEAQPLGAGEFRAPVLSGIAWKALSRGLFEATRLAVAIVLAHILTPREYGVAGMVLVVLGFEPVLGGVALASALVRRPVISDEERNTVFWTNAGIGLAVCLAGIAISRPVADFYGDPAVAPLFAAMSVVFLLSALSSVQVHLLVREMQFRSLELRNMAGAVAGAAAAIAVAAAGGGAWALIAQQLAAFSVALVLLWRFSPWRPRMTYSRRALRELRGFGGNVSATLVLFQLNQNTDNVLIGRFLGASPLGAYALAYNIILVPFSRLVAPLHDVLYPVFSRLQDDHARLSAIWLRTLRMVAAVAVPAGLGLIVVAPDAVDVIFGRRWHAAIPVVQILSGVGLLFLLQGLNSVVLQAIDRTRLLFHYALVSFLAGVTSFAIGLHWGIVGVAGCFAVVSAVIQPAYMHLTARAVGIGLRDCARALGGVLIAALIATAGVAAIHTAMVAGGVGPPLRLVIAVVFAINLYLLACLFCAGDLVDELRRFVPQRFQLRPSLGS